MLYLVNKPLLAAGISADRLIDRTINEQLVEKPFISALFHWYKIGRRLLEDTVNRFDNSLPYFLREKTTKELHSLNS